VIVEVEEDDIDVVEIEVDAEVEEDEVNVLVSIVIVVVVPEIVVPEVEVTETGVICGTVTSANSPSLSTILITWLLVSAKPPCPDTVIVAVFPSKSVLSDGGISADFCIPSI